MRHPHHYRIASLVHLPQAMVDTLIMIGPLILLAPLTRLLARLDQAVGILMRSFASSVGKMGITQIIAQIVTYLAIVED